MDIQRHSAIYTQNWLQLSGIMTECWKSGCRRLMAGTGLAMIWPKPPTLRITLPSLRPIITMADRRPLLQITRHLLLRRTTPRRQLSQAIPHKISNRITLNLKASTPKLIQALRLLQMLTSHPTPIAFHKSLRRLRRNLHRTIRMHLVNRHIPQRLSTHCQTRGNMQERRTLKHR